jgi:hypothetical protein
MECSDCCIYKDRNGIAQLRKEDVPYVCRRKMLKHILLNFMEAKKRRQKY